MPETHILTKLSFDMLPTDTIEHILKLVTSIIIAGHSHPAFENFFRIEVSNSLIIVHKPGIKMGSKRFKIYGSSTYNKLRSAAMLPS